MSAIHDNQGNILIALGIWGKYTHDLLYQVLEVRGSNPGSGSNFYLVTSYVTFTITSSFQLNAMVRKIVETTLRLQQQKN